MNMYNRNTRVLKNYMDSDSDLFIICEIEFLNINF